MEKVLVGLWIVIPSVLVGLTVFAEKVQQATRSERIGSERVKNLRRIINNQKEELPTRIDFYEKKKPPFYQFSNFYLKPV